ncbi:MAG TPA: YfiR family protein, partial [Candidatus Marinimicrobia bacterium]|nr:YfiR family protein [Candidatus Neomarinimicrobiota bacterium]
VCFFLLSVNARSLPPSATDIDQLKAAFIYNFTKYISWPDASRLTSYKIGVLGDSEIFTPLRQIAEKKMINDKPIEVYHFRSLSDLRACQILFISPTVKEPIPDILGGLVNRTTLTIGDAPDLCRQGVMINFFLQSDMVKFELNPQRLEAAGFKISSQLLKLARLVAE